MIDSRNGFVIVGSARSEKTIGFSNNFRDNKSAPKVFFILLFRYAVQSF